MSDKVRQIPFGQLMSWVLGEYSSEGTVFGVRKLYDHKIGDYIYIFGKKLELPFGPAAGPHTQLAQNIIAAYAAGARFFELKTVQVLDGEDLPVSKPCIYAPDEGYNVEWSTELYVPQALDEYIKAWFALKLLSRELGLGSDDGFVFNMSVGYDLDGIKTAKIDSFIEGLKNAADTGYWKTCIKWTGDNLTRFKYVDKHMIDNITPGISNSITLSTLHGCPPEEIERIAEYMLREKGLHTYIKCNPTLLGYEYARSTLDKLGYDYLIFDDTHFKNDLQFADAVPMLGRLQKLADSLNLEFGVKLTNTFPVQIKKNELPGDEMYMSGRALFPLSIEVARRLSDAFGGKLAISYSGGADARNIASLYKAGIRPVTVATTLLKPGGYDRLYQIAAILRDTVTYDDEGETGHNVRVLNTGLITEITGDSSVYRKPPGLLPERKINAKLPLTDCYTAPCRDGCPFGQDVPAYLRLTGEGKYLEALRIITERNPLPFITGTICSHNCMNKCTRFYYEESVDIRAVKLDAAQKAFKQLLTEVSVCPKKQDESSKVAIVGGGPAGLSAAYFLARAGLSVTVFEQRQSLGGVPRHVIPGFRIGSEAIDNDTELVTAMGVDIRLNTEVTDLGRLRSEGYKHIIIAAGAWKPGVLKLQEGSAVDALAFLEELKKNPGCTAPGENIVIAGGGNTAMDTARAAVRIKGVKKVTLVYRRTRRYMPAAPEETELAVQDGVEFLELTAPVGMTQGILTCNVMELGAPDLSDRPSAVPTGKTVSIPCDMLISAIGNRVDDSLWAGLEREDIHIIGDAAGGAATVAGAIADAAKCAADIAGAEFDRFSHLNVNPGAPASKDKIYGKRGVLYNCKSGTAGPDKCLECATVCEACAEVCPNRANICIITDNRPQIIHIDFMCNECGNCAVFCPYDGAPYLDKFTYFIYGQDFENSGNTGFLVSEDGTIRVRLDGKVTDCRDTSKLPEDVRKLIEASIEKFKNWFL